jgi:Fic family protein
VNQYIHQLPDWPCFKWDDGALSSRLAAVRHKQGLLLGRMEGMGFSLRSEALLHTLTLDVLKTSEIEGDILDAAQVRSSLARRLGLDIGALVDADRHVDGVVAMLLDATQNHDKPLSQERLWGWHAALFPTGYSGMRMVRVGCWRDDVQGSMQVVSGPFGRERVHFEAPAALRLEAEMAAFLDRFNRQEPLDLFLKAALAHLWFVTLHPFEDGNGRIARALTDMLLARSDGTPQRFYSMSAQIRQERNAYYDILERTQSGDMDITAWIEWFLDCLGRALDGTEIQLDIVLHKARFWQNLSTAGCNERQCLLLNKLLDGFTGNLTSSKWAKIAKCSQDTALRDIQDLLGRGLLAKTASGGRSTHYLLVRETARIKS